MLHEYRQRLLKCIVGWIVFQIFRHKYKNSGGTDVAVLSRRQVVSPFSSQGTEEWQKVNLHAVSITLSISHCLEGKSPCRIRIN